MQTICPSLQTDNHTITSSLNFLQARCCSWRPTDSIKALKAKTTTKFTLYQYKKTAVYPNVHSDRSKTAEVVKETILYTTTSPKCQHDTE